MNRHRLSHAAAVAFIASLLAFAGPAAPRADETRNRVELLRVPDQGLQPKVVVDEKGVVHLTYFKGEPSHGDVFYARIDGKNGISRPVQVNTAPDSAIATGNVRGPQLAVGRQGRVHVAWMGSDRAPRALDAVPMLYTHMRSDGTFEAERNIHQNAGPIDGGSIAADEAGGVYVSWHAEMPGEKGEANRRAWVARSTDEGQTFAKEEAASPAAFGACGCCGTGGFVDRQGSLYVLFRAAHEEEHRDTVLLRSIDRGRTFSARSLQDWNLKACPMSTFSMAEGAGAVVAAWETAGQVYWTRVDRAGDPIAAPGGTGVRKHPSIARNAHGETLLAWTEGMGWSKGGSLAWQRYDGNGAPAGAIGRADGVPAWSLVAVYPRADGTFTIIY